MSAVVLLVLGAALFVLAQLRAPEIGSEEDLGGQIDALQIPSSLTQLGQHYTPECPGTPCPTLVRWYGGSAAAETLKAELISNMTSARVVVSENSLKPLIFTGRNDRYIFFVVLDTQMIAGNKFAPPGTAAEIVVSPLPDLE